MVKQFRLASRELFNCFFRVSNPYENDGWILYERFRDVEKKLFEKLVTEPAGLSLTAYGDTQKELLVELRDSASAPIMVNRKIESGYWDHPISEVTSKARMLFICFFDWDKLSCLDNSFVRVCIDQWPSHTELVGKHALIQSHHVRFVKLMRDGLV